MQYPSFIWANGIEDNQTREPSVAPNVAQDLKLTWIISARPEIRRYYSIICTAEDILKRQRLFSSCEDSNIITVLRYIRECVRNFRSAGAVYKTISTDDAEQESDEFEKSICFTIMCSEFLKLTEALASLNDTDDALTEVGSFFKTVSDDDRIVNLKLDLDAINHQPHGPVSVNVSGMTIGVATADDTMKSKFAYWFENMGISSELPSNKPLLRADNKIIMAYSSLYYEYSSLTAEFYSKYKSLIIDEFEAEKLSLYNDELTFVIETTNSLDSFRKAGWSMTNPSISAERKIEVSALRDAALITRGEDVSAIVPNDVAMYAEKDGEKLPFWLLTGANGGGKTTYLRSVGSCVLMFLLGLPVCAEKAEIYIFSRLFTHFPLDEEFESNGRFIDELNRVNEITDVCDNDSVVLLNETFSGTDEKKSEDYSSALAKELYTRGTFGLFVTHIHKLTEGDIPVLSVVIDETDENRRTYRIKRVKSTHSSFAMDILKKYGMDPDSLEKKIADMNKSEGGSQNG